MNYKLLLLIVIVFTTGALMAQNTILRQPVKFVSPKDNVIIWGKNSQSSANTAPRPWKVIADHDQTITYRTPQLTEKLGTINLGEVFFVIDETDSTIHIANIDDYNPGDLSFEAFEDFGWVRKNDIMLWIACLKDPAFYVSKKAIVLNSLSVASSFEQGDETGVLSYYNDPYLMIKNDHKSLMFEIIYIYKFSADRKSVLLGKVSKIGNFKNIKETLLGWAPASKLVLWNTRAAIEPNFDPDAIFDRQEYNNRFDEKRGVKAMIFTTRPDAIRYLKEFTFNRKMVLWDDDFAFNKSNDYKQYIGTYKRNPLIENDPVTGTMKVGAFGSVGSDGKSGLPIETLARIDSTINDINKRIRNISILFVIDGTTSMEPYFDAVAEAVKESMKSLSQQKSNQIRFGAVVYRDFNEGAYLTERIRLNSNYVDVAHWLSTVFSAEKNVNDKDDAEAVFYGINDAFRNCGLSKDESNYLVVIGDAGNHHRQDASQRTAEETSELFKNFNMHLMAFQVHNKGSEAYLNFSGQLKDVLMSSAYRVWKQNEGINEKLGIKEPQLHKGVNGIYEMKGGALSGRIITCASNQMVSPKDLQNQLTNWIIDVEEDVQDTKDKLEALKSGSILEFDPAMIKILLDAGVTEQQIQILSQKRFQFFTLGYAANITPNLQQSFFNIIFLMTKEELSEIKLNISRALGANNYSDTRKQLYGTLMDLASKKTGESVEDLDEIPFGNLMKLLFGNGSRATEIIQGGYPADILDPRKVTESQINRLVDLFEECNTKLAAFINNDKNKFEFRSYDEIYYWVSQDLLP